MKESSFRRLSRTVNFTAVFSCKCGEGVMLSLSGLPTIKSLLKMDNHKSVDWWLLSGCRYNIVTINIWKEEKIRDMGQMIHAWQSNLRLFRKFATFSYPAIDCVQVVFTCAHSRPPLSIIMVTTQGRRGGEGRRGDNIGASSCHKIRFLLGMCHNKSHIFFQAILFQYHSL